MPRDRIRLAVDATLVEATLALRRMFSPFGQPTLKFRRRAGTTDATEADPKTFPTPMQGPRT